MLRIENRLEVTGLSSLSTDTGLPSSSSLPRRPHTVQRGGAVVLVKMQFGATRSIAQRSANCSSRVDARLGRVRTTPTLLWWCRAGLYEQALDHRETLAHLLFHGLDGRASF